MYVPDGASEMKEIWKPIAGYEGVYEVSNLGKVKSLKRKVIRSGKSMFVHGGILKPNIINGGYEQIKLFKSGKAKMFLVHRLVAETFLPNPKKLPQVNHIDGNKLNNKLENIEWCTAKENMVHSVTHRIRRDIKPVDMLSEDGEYIKTFNSIKEAARESGVSHNHISRCCREIYGCKSAGGYCWRFSKEDV